MSATTFYLMGAVAMGVYAALFFGVGRRRIRDISPASWLAVLTAAALWPAIALAAAWCCAFERGGE